MKTVGENMIQHLAVEWKGTCIVNKLLIVSKSNPKKRKKTGILCYCILDL